jgi:TolA-binding protein
MKRKINNGMKRSGAFALFASLVMEMGATAPAQILNADASGYYERGILMLSDKNYVGAADQLRHALDECRYHSDPAAEECMYWYAVASAMCGDMQSTELLESFLATYPASAHASEAKLLLADRYFFNHDFAKAAAAYSDIDFNALNSAKAATYNYRYSLSLLKIGDYNRAEGGFSSLASDKEYGTASKYYLAYIDYVRGKYNSAYDAFKSLESPLRQLNSSNDEDYLPTALDASYYIAQIDFSRGEYRSVAKRAAQLINEAPDATFTAEAQRLAGESYYKLGETSKAEPLLREYVRYAGEAAAPTALYALGVIEYDNGDYSAAEEHFELVTSDPSAVAQSAYLYLGQCSARKGNNTSAALAFDKAYRMAYDNTVSETALYDYVAAVTAGGNIPFSSSIDILEEFLKKYPKSQYASRVEEYLSAAYYHEKDYTKALASINHISKPTTSALQAKQLVLYELGVQELSNSDYTSATTHLKEAASMTRYNKDVANEAQLWLAQSLYAQGDYTAAQKAGESYIKTDKSGKNSALATYDLAYSLYQQDKFSNAATYFEKAYNSTTLPSSLKPDALERAADCYYYSGNYTKAKALYNQAERSGSGDAAYAAMRAANMEGLRGDNTKKATELKQMIANYPNSKWVPEAMMELASAYTASGKTKEAISTYSDVVKKYPSASQARQAQLQMATLYAKTDENKAIEACKTLIERWPSSEEAATANVDLRNMMGNKGQLSDYVSFINSIPGAPKVDVNEIETIAFDAAENQWIQDSSSVAALEKYVSDYPDGTYLASALADLAISYNDKKEYEKALNAIDQLTAKRPTAAQIPEALSLKAEIIEAKYPSRGSEALSAYRQLEQWGDAAYLPEAYLGIARLSSTAKEQLAYAEKAERVSGASAAQITEAQYIKAQALISLNRGDEAVTILTTLAENPDALFGAKGAVLLGEYYNDKKQYAQAEKVLTAFTNEGTPHQYWLARGYIALADAYTGLGKKSTAKEYLTSLRDNYPGTESDIRQMINKRLK